MSRGAGRIEQAIERAFTSCRDQALMTDELCFLAYAGINRVEKKHRFAVTRAMRSIVERCPEFGILKSSLPGNPLVLFDKRSLASVAEADRKGASYHHAPDFAPDGPWARAMRLAVALAANDHHAADKVRSTMHGPGSFAYIAGHRLLDALLGSDAFDRYLSTKSATAVITQGTT